MSVAATVLDGRAAARALSAEVLGVVSELPYTPRLVFIRAGDDPASASYVRSKSRLAERAGILAETKVLDPRTEQGELMRLIAELNEDRDVDGILVQLPLYPHLDSRPVLAAVDPAKDVDGFNPVNVGRLWSGQPGLFPATPMGLIHLLDRYRIPIAGRHVVIVGRSNLVGKPAAGLFLRRDATVSLAHSRTRELSALTSVADIVVAAAGVPAMITAEMVKPGAVVLDVGQSPGDGGLRGDVAADVAAVASAITPTPGGTGPMTVAMVIANTLSAARSRRSVDG